MKNTYDSTFWKAYFKTYDILLYVIPYRELLQELVDSIDLGPGDKLLDAGGGTGNIGYHICGEIELTILDQSKEALSLAHSKHPLTKTFLQNITESLPYADNTFDHIISNNALYTLPYTLWKPCIAEWYRVLRPGGKLVLSNIHNGFSIWDIYGQHISKSIKKYGIFITLVQLISLSVGTAKMFYYNHLIKKKNSYGVYRFIQQNEQSELMRDVGFIVTEEEKRVYAEQAWMSIGKK